MCVLTSKEIHNVESLFGSKSDLNHLSKLTNYNEIFKVKTKEHIFKLKDEDALTPKIMNHISGVKDAEKMIDHFAYLLFNGKT